MLVTSTKNRTRRFVAAGAFAVAAVAAPLAASMLGAADQGQVTAQQCLAWFGNKEDGKCLGYSNGNGVNVGTPQIGLDQGGPAFSTGPLFPGRIYGGGTGF